MAAVFGAHVSDTDILLDPETNIARKKQPLAGYFADPPNYGTDRVVGDKERWVELVSYKPRVYLYHNFLSDEECDHIIATAKPRMKRSTVVGDHGQSVVDNYRTSYGTFLGRRHDDVVSEIEDRVASWVHLNATHQEDMQVLRYGYFQKYGKHMDSLDDDSPRVATVLMYLNDVEEGGETAFPDGSEWINPQLQEQYGSGLSECAYGHVAAKPTKGMALVFYSLKPDGTHDPHAMHTACPILKGTKWVAIKWIHTKPFRPESFGDAIADELGGHLPDDCEDLDTRCPQWADKGECVSNEQFMTGDNFSLGMCRKSCNKCEVCAPKDTSCRTRNRLSAGYLSLEDNQL